MTRLIYKKETLDGIVRYVTKDLPKQSVKRFLVT